MKNNTLKNYLKIFMIIIGNHIEQKYMEMIRKG